MGGQAFSNEFVDVRTGEAAADKPLLYTGVLADGLNLGLSAWPRHARNISVPPLLAVPVEHPRRNLCQCVSPR